MKQINIGLIGTGWCGGIRANTCAGSALVNELHLAEINEERLAEIKAETNPTSATTDYREVIARDNIDAIIISATPETTHYPIAKESLQAGKHVFLEKPLALTLDEADELLDIANKNERKFAIGYSQRFNPKFAYAKKSLVDKTIGDPVCALVSRHITRGLGNKIGGRIKLSPAVMEATHDIDFALWCMEPAKPVRVYSQSAYGAMKDVTGLEDAQWTMITLDNGAVLTIGAGWTMPPGHPNYSGTWIEVTGTDGMLVIDDTHRDVIFNTMANGIRLPMSSMPGEPVGHVFAGPMHDETVHFIEAIALDRPVMATAEQARAVMEVYLAADMSVASGEPVSLPLAQTAASAAAVA
ncbi:MAG: Gfo/Idh/MocA family oxidoreductase [Gammaproteobacteria bacterium]|nr:Gfo/Idh/MocA family oxidoreductase [Gammaproteobacteria bacterium]